MYVCMWGASESHFTNNSLYPAKDVRHVQKWHYILHSGGYISESECAYELVTCDKWTEIQVQI